MQSIRSGVVSEYDYGRVSIGIQEWSNLGAQLKLKPTESDFTEQNYKQRTEQRQQGRFRASPGGIRRNAKLGTSSSGCVYRCQVDSGRVEFTALQFQISII